MIVAAEDAVGELPQLLRIPSRRIGRKAAVADHLRGHSLHELVAPALEHLKVRVRMCVYESWSDRQAGAVDRSRFYIVECSNSFNAAVANEYIRGYRRSTRAVENVAVFQQPCACHEKAKYTSDLWLRDLLERLR